MRTKSIMYNTKFYAIWIRSSGLITVLKMEIILNSDNYNIFSNFNLYTNNLLDYIISA